MKGPTLEDFSILYERLRGRTLDGISRDLGVSRERVRQRITQAVKRFWHAAQRYQAAEEQCRLKAARLRYLETLSLSSPAPVDSTEAPLDVLDLPSGLYLILKRAGVHTVEELTRMSISDLRAVRGFRLKFVQEIKRELARFGYELHRE